MKVPADQGNVEATLEASSPVRGVGGAQASGAAIGSQQQDEVPGQLAGYRLWCNSGRGGRPQSLGIGGSAASTGDWAKFTGTYPSPNRL